jgi:RNase H-like domain found in reverse transcriptase
MFHQFATRDLLGDPEKAVAVFKAGIVSMRGIVTKKKFKPVAKKVRPVVAQLPGKYRIIQDIQGDPFFLCQCSAADVKKKIYSRFGSITLNEREARFSQPKLEIYGLYRALRALRMYMIGLRKFVVETDVKYIKGMLANPDIQPSASINRWIVSILTFHFDLVHIKGTFHGPDGLSRRPKQLLDPEIDADDFNFEDWVDHLHGFMHQIQPLPFSKKKVFAGAQILSVEETDMKEITLILSRVV